MNFKALLDSEVSIRLTEDMTGFVSTVRRGLFRTEVAVHVNLNAPLEAVSDLVRTKQSWPVVVHRPWRASSQS